VGFAVGSFLRVLDGDFSAFCDLQLEQLRVAIFVNDLRHAIFFEEFAD
jgi:hypothetical protein